MKNLSLNLHIKLLSPASGNHLKLGQYQANDLFIMPLEHPDFWKRDLSMDRLASPRFAHVTTR